MKEQFDIIINSKDLKDVTIDIVEKVLDNQISDEALREVPILKSLVAIKSLYSSYSDRIFIKKAMTVLLELGEVNWKQRVEVSRELNDEDSSGMEKILMAIDKLETIKKCKVYGRLCRLRAHNKITVEDFLRLTKLIQDAYLEELILVRFFHNSLMRKEAGLKKDEYAPLISLALIFEDTPDQVTMTRSKNVKSLFRNKEKNIQKIPNEFDYDLTPLGMLLFNHYDDLFV